MKLDEKLDDKLLAQLKGKFWVFINIEWFRRRNCSQLKRKEWMKNDPVILFTFHWKDYCFHKCLPISCICMNKIIPKVNCICHLRVYRFLKLYPLVNQFGSDTIILIWIALEKIVFYYVTMFLVLHSFFRVIVFDKCRTVLTIHVHSIKTCSFYV